MGFDAKTMIPDELFARLVQSRIDRPQFAEFSAERRQKRSKIAPDGRLNIVAADHPARGVVSVGDDALKMADRRDYLARVMRALSGQGVDGVMATMDILEELLILDQLRFERGEGSFLEKKLLIASLNRGGIRSAAWELNDPVTGTSPEICARFGLDGVKLLMRVNYKERDSLDTIMACAEVINACGVQRLPVFLEPLPVRRNDSGAWVVERTAEAMSLLLGIASALGSGTSRMWLKLPYCEEFYRVARATTLPILLLGGEAKDELLGLLAEIEQGLAARPNVRGAMVGRNILYPASDDPLEAAEAIGRVVHDRLIAPEAITPNPDLG